jgi:membrane protein
MFKFFKRVIGEYGKDKCGQLAAAFAYVAVFSIGPLLLVLVSIVGFVYGQKAASGQLYGQLARAVGPQTATTLQNLVAHLNQSGSGAAALAFGVVGLLLGAIGLTTQLQNAFDVILRAMPDPKAGFKFTVYTKFKNLLVMIAAGTVAIVSVVLSAIISAVGKGFGAEVLNAVGSLVVFIAMLYLVYRVLPDVIIPRLLVLKSALVVSVLFLIGKIVLGFIIGRNGTASAYGAAASLVVLMLWFYYSALILLIGAEGIKVYAEGAKLTLLPKRYTVKLKEIDIPVKKDLRGRALEAFSRGYKNKSQH